MNEHNPGAVVRSFLEKFGPGEGFDEVMRLLRDGAEEILPVLENAANLISADEWTQVVRAAHRTANFAAAVNDSILNNAAVETERAARNRHEAAAISRCTELAGLFTALADEAAQALK